MGGTKYDDGKLRMDLIPYEALAGMAEVLGFGADKYSEHNWRKGMKHSRLYAATLRHLTAYWNGETIDPESGLNHLHHALTDIAMLVTLKDGDDRYCSDEVGSTDEVDSTDDEYMESLEAEASSIVWAYRNVGR